LQAIDNLLQANLHSAPFVFTISTTRAGHKHDMC